MKNIRLKPIGMIAAVVFGLLLGWGFYSLANPLSNIVLLACVVFITITSYLSGILAFENTSRAMTSVRVASTLFAVGSLIMDTVFACFIFNETIFAIVNIGLLMMWLLIVNSLANVNDSQDKNRKLSNN